MSNNRLRTTLIVGAPTATVGALATPGGYPAATGMAPAATVGASTVPSGAPAATVGAPAASV